MLAYIGIGSNLGDAMDNCRRAVQAISLDTSNQLLRCSPFYRTEPMGKMDQPWFVNGVVAVETLLTPRDLLKFMHSIEKKMGRERRERWEPRIIDLDILFYDKKIVNEVDLQIPHPRLHERRFVLVPLRDIAPDLIHPVLAKTVSKILSELSETERVDLILERGRKLCPA
jgi:2-amino-4-hydroxy-6-hydroxymethyldihydropteridine diphosphokinase